jgi:hypothetical protein
MNNKVIAGIIVVVIALALVPVASKMMGSSGAASAPAGSPGANGGTDLAAVATEVATALTQGNFDAAAARFDTTMKSAMDASKWNQAWAGVASQLGAFKQQTGTRVTSSQGYDIVFVGCEFERGKADLQLTFNASGQVSGLFIR